MFSQTQDKTPKFDKIQKSLEEQKRLLEGQKRVSISMNSNQEQWDINENERDSESYDSQKSTTVFFQNKSSLQGCDISSSGYESAHGTIDKSKKNYKKSTKRDIILKHILDQNEGYEKLAVSKNADLGGLDSDDEVYLLQMPKSIDPKLMEGISFSLLNKSKLKLGSEKYYLRPQCNNLKSFTTLSNNTIKTIKPLATLKIEKKHKN
ncbi:hypothetical protein WA026_004067 [Henosepilachna vigintioctopunctata]|uniref:Uncharacterized protein n=1 Tax=Henosepilachna vigintioctopunctata TaxID=420089 RepID=A0AAW1U685_9CUCU